MVQKALNKNSYFCFHLSRTEQRREKREKTAKSFNNGGRQPYMPPPSPVTASSRNC